MNIFHSNLLLLVLFLLPGGDYLCAAKRNYICESKFRDCADYLITSASCSFDPEIIEPRSIVYVKRDFLGYFFTRVFPRITNPIILILNGHDYPNPNIYAPYLNDPRIVMCFGVNCDSAPHPKFCPIPIGLANNNWSHGDQKVFDKILDTLSSNSASERLDRLYINFAFGTNPVRGELLQAFANNKFATITQRKELTNYLTEMSNHRYVLSPFGNGLDCHRTWEALLVGAIPVVKTSTLDPLYKNLPVIIVNDWNEITPENLDRHYQAMQNKTYAHEKLFMDYWIKLIMSYKKSPTIELFDAAQRGDVAKISQALAAGASINAPDTTNNNMTALMYACQNAQADAVAALIAANADLMLAAADGTTAFMYAVKTANWQTIDAMIVASNLSTGLHMK